MGFTSTFPPDPSDDIKARFYLYNSSGPAAVAIISDNVAGSGSNTIPSVVIPAGFLPPDGNCPTGLELVVTTGASDFEASFSWTK